MLLLRCLSVQVERISFEEFFTHPWLTAAGVAFDDIQLPLAAADYSRSSNTSGKLPNQIHRTRISMLSSGFCVDRILIIFW
jgi:uncharacterized membrane protein YidH (DUF202 family)